MSSLDSLDLLGRRMIIVDGDLICFGEQVAYPSLRLHRSRFNFFIAHHATINATPENLALEFLKQRCAIHIPLDEATGRPLSFTALEHHHLKKASLFIHPGNRDRIPLPDNAPFACLYLKTHYQEFYVFFATHSPLASLQNAWPQLVISAALYTLFLLHFAKAAPPFFACNMPALFFHLKNEEYLPKSITPFYHPLLPTLLDILPHTIDQNYHAAERPLYLLSRNHWLKSLHLTPNAAFLQIPLVTKDFPS